jgi:hypothetical protein
MDPARNAVLTPPNFENHLLAKEDGRAAEQVRRRVSSEVHKQPDGRLKGFDSESQAFLKMIFLKKIEAYHEF